MEENKQQLEKNQNQENATNSNSQKSIQKPKRDRPDRPKRAANPHRRPKQPNKTVSSILEKENLKEIEKSKRTLNRQGKSQQKKTQNKKNEYSKSTKQNKKTNRNGNGRRSKRNISGSISDAMKASILENIEVNDLRMNPWKQITHNNHKVRFTPLGGLGEIGGNIAVMEDDESAIIIDVGMSFPDETMHGVDILVPDFSYLHAIKDKIAGIVITHAHEDHIGAVPYLYKELQFPIWGTPLALAMIENKFQEHGLMENVKLFNFVTKRRQYQIGSFKVEWIHNTHSIIDACSLAIESKAGVFIHTADFKIDHTPIDNQTMDLQRLAYYGSKGVLCLFSDSTNSHNPGYTKSEAVVGKTFDRLFALATGRVIMSTFSSNTHRIFQAMERGVEAGRKICVIGRSMERNIETTRRLGYIDIDEKHFIDSHEIPKYPDDKLLIVTTGSQGEMMAALSRMATNEHRHVKLKPSDTIIISAHAIPGNESSVSSLMNKLVKAGVTVRYKDFENIHVSGHAAQEEQKLILRLIQPKFFLPVHGEYNHIFKHSKTAIECGVNPRNILLMSDGDQIEITTKYLKKVKTVKIGKSYIDNQNNKEIKADVVESRQKLSQDGIVHIAMQINKSTKKLIGKAVVNSSGLIPGKEIKRFTNEIENIIDTFLINADEKKLASSNSIQKEISGIVRKFIIRTKKRYPIINTVVFMV